MTELIAPAGPAVDRHFLSGPPDESHLQLVRAAAAAGRTSVTAWWEPDKIIISPPVRPGTPGCLRCLAARRSACQPEAVPAIHRHAARGDIAFTARHGLVLPVVREIMVRASVADPEPPHAVFHVLRLRDLAVTQARFLPDPLCPDCGGLPGDEPLPEREFTAPVPKLAARTFRSRDLHAHADQLRSLYVDAEAGLVRRLRRSAHGLFPTATAPAGLRVAASQEIGFGRQTDYLSAELTALAEALERVGGAQPGGRRTVVRDSWANLCDVARDPRDFGLHAPEQYRGRNFPFTPFDVNASIPWVWARDLRNRRDVLVPECLAYYEPLYHRTPDRSLAYEISNGCALGATLTESVLHGLLEIAERDAFLLTWYQRRRPIEIRLDPVADTRLSLMVERIEALSGYRLRLLDVTDDLAIPAVWVLAVDEHDRPGQPKALCAGGAHLDLRRALENALLELAPFTAEFPPAYRANRDRALAMLADSDEVRHMEDHRLLYCAPEAYVRLEFLTDPVEQLSTDEAVSRHPLADRHLDLRDDLEDLITRIGSAGLDVLVVDQTVPEHRLAGLRCAKVLVPGSIPMTFGHWARRTHGLARLRGGADGLNPYPHPFP